MLYVSESQKQAPFKCQPTADEIILSSPKNEVDVDSYFYQCAKDYNDKQ